MTATEKVIQIVTELNDLNISQNEVLEKMDELNMSSFFTEESDVDYIVDSSLNDNFWGSFLSAFINTGNMYSVTIFYIVSQRKFIACSYLEFHRKYLN